MGKLRPVRGKVVWRSINGVGADMQIALKDACRAGAVAFTGGRAGAAHTHQFSLLSNRTPLILRTLATQSCVPLARTHPQAFTHLLSLPPLPGRFLIILKALLHSLLLHTVFLARSPPPAQCSVLLQALVLPTDTNLLVAQGSPALVSTRKQVPQGQ